MLALEFLYEKLHQAVVEVLAAEVRVVRSRLSPNGTAAAT